jgi:hypothetical protein
MLLPSHAAREVSRPVISVPPTVMVMSKESPLC